MRHLGIVASSAPQPTVPTVSISSVTNFNQNRATLNGTVSANNGETSIKFQISANNGTDWYDAIGGTAISNTSSNNVTVYYNTNGYYVSTKVPDMPLDPGSTYLVRLVATNSAGTATSSTASFTTWSLKTYRNGPSGSNDTLTGNQTFTIPTITPTGSTAVMPTILNLIVVGGGGGSQDRGGGGGGGAFNSAASRSFSDTSTTTLSISIGAGGAGSNTVDSGGTGGTSSITASNFTTLSASGGTGASFSLGVGTVPGSTPAGENSAYSGGNTSSIDEYKGSNYATGAGGGAGSSGNGGNGTTGVGGTWAAQGGNGGDGRYYSTGNFNHGAGGYGGATSSTGPATSGSYGANSSAISGVGPYGRGGPGVLYGASGTIGVVYFQYYAA